MKNVLNDIDHKVDIIKERESEISLRSIAAGKLLNELASRAMNEDVVISFKFFQKRLLWKKEIENYELRFHADGSFYYHFSDNEERNLLLEEAEELLRSGGLIGLRILLDYVQKKRVKVLVYRPPPV